MGASGCNATCCAGGGGLFTAVVLVLVVQAFTEGTRMELEALLAVPEELLRRTWRPDAQSNGPVAVVQAFIEGTAIELLVVEAAAVGVFCGLADFLPVPSLPDKCSEELLSASGGLLRRSNGGGGGDGCTAAADAETCCGAGLLNGDLGLVVDLW